MTSATAQNSSPDNILATLLNKNPDLFGTVLEKKDEFNIQIIYTQIQRKKKGNNQKHKIELTDFSFNLNPDKYYYPASTVKLPVAILALQKLNELKIAGLDKNSTMITMAGAEGQTEVYKDSSAIDGRPTIAHYIKKILLVSDNDAFNRLYEFLGQEYINNSLHKMGFADAQIIHHLQISLPEEQNRLTNPVRFIDAGGKIIYEKPLEKSKMVYASRNTKLGNGYMRGNELIDEPFDFSKKNRLPLAELHAILKSVMFPAAVPNNQRFNLTEEDYAFLHKYMSMLPRESVTPVYDAAEYGDSYVKFLYYGSERTKANPDIRIFNKPGDAYGFMVDAAYIIDYKNNIEFMLSAIIYCNSDGIFNDDKYDYEKLGLPFLKSLGRVIYDYELKRNNKHSVELSGLRLQYSR